MVKGNYFQQLHTIAYVYKVYRNIYFNFYFAVFSIVLAIIYLVSLYHNTITVYFKTLKKKKNLAIVKFEECNEYLAYNGFTDHYNVPFQSLCPI